MKNRVSDKMKLFATDYQNIETLSLLSADGRQVKKMEHFSGEEVQISVADLNEGIYLLRIIYVDGE